LEKSQERQLHKSSEGEFIFELHHEYELSPRESESILETAKRCLIRENILKEGEIEVSVISTEERSGKVVENMRKVRVRLTIDNGLEDLEVLKNSGRVSLRRVRIQRVSQEAIEQKGILSQEDLGKYLSCDLRTIKRDIREIKQSGIEVTTRGVLHNIGRGQTHKVKIVGLFLEGKTYSEIKLNFYKKKFHLLLIYPTEGRLLLKLHFLKNYLLKLKRKGTKNEKIFLNSFSSFSFRHFSRIFK